jgi:ATP-dependent Clp protease adaptor protein ClpS
MRGTPRDLPFERHNGEYQSVDTYCLVLFNDDVNSFDFIIESLINICEHNPQQAEQCAIIAHYKGKCDVKLGSYDQLFELKSEFDLKGITTSICEN